MKMKKLLSAALTVVITAFALIVPASAADKLPAPKTITATAKSESSVKVKWSAVTGADRYYVLYSTDGKTYKTYGHTTKTSVTVKKLSTGVKYRFRVQAAQVVDGKVIKGEYSKAAKVTLSAKEEEQEGIKIVTAPGTVKNGKKATLKIKGKPNTKYSVSVQYKTKSADAKGIGSVTSDAEGYAEWTWKVGSNTSEGEHPIIITDGTNTYKTSFKTVKK